MPEFRDAGECALVVNFGDRIDDALTDRVLALLTAFDPPPGVAECVPTYRSLMVHYDPLVLSRDALVLALHQALHASAPTTGGGTLWHLPACYDPALGPDQAHVAAVTGLSVAQVIELHQQATYRLVMYGFAPGWAYLSGLPPELTLPRRATPRDRIPGGSLIIAGGQAVVAGGPMPSGWHMLGQTPERMFAPDRAPAFLFAPGDRIRFDPVDRPMFDSLSARAAAGEPLARRATP